MLPTGPSDRLPPAWLNYAALDVEVLIELRAAIAADLGPAGQNQLGGRGIRLSADVRGPSCRRVRGATAGGERRAFTGCATRRALAAVRELWTTRDQIAQPPRHRAAAGSCPIPPSSTPRWPTRRSVDDLVALPVFGGRRQRRSAATWLSALRPPGQNQRSAAGDRTPPNGPPPPARWSRRKPDAAARLESRPCGAVGAVASRSEFRRRTWSCPTWYGGCAGNGTLWAIGRTDPVAITEELPVHRCRARSVAARAGGSRSGRGDATGPANRALNPTTSRGAR